ncbi:MAG: hypothetical protein MUP73_07520 [Dehalococcoidia bacterium]|nr:hypothetical protein [Dehalococcoidia bacterium]
MEVVRSVGWPFGLRINPVKPDGDSTTPPAGGTLIPPPEGIPQEILKQVQHDNTEQPTLTHWWSGYPFFSDLLDIM